MRNACHPISIHVALIFSGSLDVTLDGPLPALRRGLRRPDYSLRHRRNQAMEDISLQPMEMLEIESIYRFNRGWFFASFARNGIITKYFPHPVPLYLPPGNHLQVHGLAVMALDALLRGLSLSGVLTAVAISSLFLVFVRRRYGSSISDVPGPFIGSFSVLWLLWNIFRGQLGQATIEAHRKYGCCTSTMLKRRIVS